MRVYLRAQKVKLRPQLLMPGVLQLRFYPEAVRNIYSYNAGRQRTGVLWQSWNTTTGTWANLTRFAYQYDAAGRDSVGIQQKWIAATGSWKNVTRNQTRYTTFNKIDGLKSQRWSDTTAVWKDSTDTINHYNSSNYLVSVVHGPFYNPNSFNLFDSLAYTALNAAGSPLVAIGYQGNPSGSTISWLPDLRYIYTYNSANQQLSNQLEMIDKNYVGFNSLTGIFEYNSAGQLTADEQVNVGTGYNLYKTLYKCYYESTTAVPNSGGITESGIAVMPSPATSLVTVSIGENVKGNIQGVLVDAGGKTMLYWNEPAETNRSWQFSVAELPAGFYFVRLSGNGFSGSKILVVQH